MSIPSERRKPNPKMMDTIKNNDIISKDDISVKYGYYHP